MNRREIAKAWLRYQQTRLHAWWRLATGRCPACPKKRHGPHKFGCSRPGSVPPSLRAIRRQDREGT